MRRRSPAILYLAFCLSTLLALSSAAQERQPWQFPVELRSDLESRVKLFVTAQAEARWDQVSELLGNYRRGFVGYKEFTAAHKACLISQMQRFPMVSFDYTIQETPYSSEILSTPPGRRWWTLVGEGNFLSGVEPVKKKAWLIAYRDRDQWFFTPSNFDDNASARSQFKPEDISRDVGDQIEARVPADSPLEIVDVHVHIDPNDLKYRVIQFRLRNRSSSRITRYGYKISDDRHDGGISFGTGKTEDAIDAGGLSRRFEERYVAYTYWCEGEPKIRIEVDHVHFEEGRDWDAPDRGE